MARAELTRRRETVSGGRSGKSHRVYVSEEETQLAAIAAAHGGISIPRLLIESTLSADRGLPNFEWHEVLTELFALRRLLAGAVTNVNQVARVANATGAVPVRQLEAELEWVGRPAGPGGRLDVVIERVAGTARAGRVDVA